jgi:hypothetical protein
MKRILLSALLTSFIAMFFYLAIWTSAMVLSGKFLLTGIVCMIHFTFALMIYEFPNRIDYDIKQEKK